jgi:hypothetical protein
MADYTIGPDLFKGIGAGVSNIFAGLGALLADEWRAAGSRLPCAQTKLSLL